MCGSKEDLIPFHNIPPPSGPEPLTRGHEFHDMYSNGLVGKCHKHYLCGSRKEYMYFLRFAFSLIYGHIHPPLTPKALP